MKQEAKKSFLFTILISMILGAVSCVFGYFLQAPQMLTVYAAEATDETSSTEDEIMPIADSSHAYMVPINMVLNQMGSSAIALSGVYINTELPPEYESLTPTEITAASGCVPVHCYLYGRALYVVSSEDPANKVYAYFSISTTASSFFMGISNAATIDVSNLDLSELPNFDYMFQNCSRLSTLIFPETMDTLQATSMNKMFPSNPALTEVNLSALDMANVTSATDMLTGLTGVKLLQTPTNIKTDVALPSVMYARDENGDIVGYDNLYEDIADTSTSITLKARYNINFDGNGSEDTSYPSYFLYNETSATLPANILTRDGYKFAGWSTTADSDQIEYADGATISLNNEDITLYAQWTADPATPATVSQVNSTSGQVYNSVDGTISVEVAAVAGHTLSYQWYSSETASNSGGVLIAGATAATYTLPEDLSVGTHYYYCEVTSEHDINGETAQVYSDVITVEVEPIKLIVLIDSKTSVYGSEIQSLTSTLINGQILAGDEDVYTIVCDEVYEGADVGKYDITGVVNDTNYDVTFINGTYEITPKDMTLSWSNTTLTYNGENQSPTVSSEDFVTGGGNNEDFVVSQFVNAGTHLATASLSENIAKNYNILNNTQLFTIDPITINLIWTNNQLTYNGQEQLPEVEYYGVLDADAEDFVIYFSGEQLNAGNYVAMATGVNNPNYKLPGNVTCLYEIASIYVHVRVHDQHAVYGQDILAVEELTYEIVTGEDAIVEGETAFGLSTGAFDGCDAGQYSIDMIWEQANYDVFCEAGTYYVSSRAITVEIDSFEKAYGEEIETLTATITEGSLLEGHSEEDVYSLYLGTDVYNVDSYEIMLEKLNTNYDITYNYAEYVITPRVLTISIDDKTSEYGASLVELTATITGELVEGEFEYSLQTWAYDGCPVGGYAIYAEYNHGNYILDSTTEKFTATYTITPKNIEIEWDSVTSFIYDGYPKAPIARADDFEILVEGAETNFGNYIATARLITYDESNYQLTNATKEFTIVAKDFTSSASVMTIADLTYTGTALTPMVNVVDGLLGALMINTDYSVEYSNNTNAGTATVTVRGLYNFSGELTQTFTINKKELVVSWSELSFSYDGNQHLPQATVEGDLVDLIVTGTGTDAGTYVATATLSNEDAQNYRLVNATTPFVISGTQTGTPEVPDTTPDDDQSTPSDDQSNATIQWISLGVAGVAVVWMAGLSCVVFKKRNKLDTKFVERPTYVSAVAQTPKTRTTTAKSTTAKKTVKKEDTTKK